MLAVYWCCSVGATWTLELRAVGRESEESSRAGPVLDWISSGVPTQMPPPEGDMVDMLAEQELQLYPDAEPPQPHSRSRWLAGYASADPDVMRLALWVAEILEGTDPAADDDFTDVADLADLADSGRTHPMPMAGRWIDAGFSLRSAADWVRAGVFSPRVAQALMCAEPEGPAGTAPSQAPSQWWHAG